MNDNEQRHERRQRFARWFIEELERVGMSERALATKIGVAPTTPRTWRLAVTLPTFDRCAEIAEAFEVPVSLVREMAGYIVGDSDTAYGDEPDPEHLAVLISAWRELSPAGRAALLTQARALLELLAPGQQEAGDHEPQEPNPARRSGK